MTPMTQTTPTRDAREAAERAVAIAHRWAVASYNKALGKPYEAFEPIQRELRDFFLASAPSPAGGVDAVKLDKAALEAASEEAYNTSMSWRDPTGMAGMISWRGTHEDVRDRTRGATRAAIQMYNSMTASASLSPAATPVSEAGGEADDALSTLALLSSYLGAGLGDASTTAEQFDKRIRWGIDNLVSATVARCADKVEELSKRPSTRWGEVKAAIQAIAPEPAALAKPASSSAVGDVVRERALAAVEKLANTNISMSLAEWNEVSGAILAALSQSTSAGRVGE